MVEEVRTWLENLTYSPVFTLLRVLECDDVFTPCIADSEAATMSSDEVREMCWEHDDEPLFHVGYEVYMIDGRHPAESAWPDDMEFIQEHFEEIEKIAVSMKHGWYTIMNEFYDDWGTTSAEGKETAAC